MFGKQLTTVALPAPSMRRLGGVKTVLFSYLWILALSPSRRCRHPFICRLC
jgi:hypothetical protein